MAERMGTLPTTPVRYAHKAPDGTIPYFEASAGRQVSGRLPAGASPDKLKAAGYQFVDRDTFLQAQKATDPQYRAEQEDVDDLAEVYDMTLGSNDGSDTLQSLLSAPQAQPGAAPRAGGGSSELTPEMLEVLQQYMDEGRLDELFQPFQQEQSVLDQQMQAAQGLRQRAPQRSTPTGALLSGLANAAGNIGGTAFQGKSLEGQSALGRRMQQDASGRTAAILREAMRRRGVNPDTGLMTPDVDDATLAQLFAGG